MTSSLPCRLEWSSAPTDLLHVRKDAVKPTTQSLEKPANLSFYNCTYELLYTHPMEESDNCLIFRALRRTVRCFSPSTKRVGVKETGTEWKDFI